MKRHLIIAAAVCAFFSGWAAVATLYAGSLEREAIARGCAEYRFDGAFVWKKGGCK